MIHLLRKIETRATFRPDTPHACSSECFWFHQCIFHFENLWTYHFRSRFEHTCSRRWLQLRWLSITGHSVDFSLCRASVRAGTVAYRARRSPWRYGGMRCRRARRHSGAARSRWSASCWYRSETNEKNVRMVGKQTMVLFRSLLNANLKFTSTWTSYFLDPMTFSFRTCSHFSMPFPCCFILYAFCGKRSQ